MVVCDRTLLAYRKEHALSQYMMYQYHYAQLSLHYIIRDLRVVLIPIAQHFFPFYMRKRTIEFSHNLVHQASFHVDPARSVGSSKANESTKLHA